MQRKKFGMIILLIILLVVIIYFLHPKSRLVVKNLNADQIIQIDNTIYIKDEDDNILKYFIPPVQAKDIKTVKFELIDKSEFSKTVSEYYEELINSNQGILSYELDTDYNLIQLNDLSVKKTVLKKTLGIVLTTEGSVYVWGNNDYGQLGIGSTEPNKDLIQIQCAEVFIDVTLCAQTAIAVDLDGNVWVWGDNSGGTCGINDISTVLTPTKLALPEKIKSVCSGQFHAFALSDTGNVYSWGETIEVLGVERDWEHTKNTPLKINNFSNVKKILTSGITAVAVDDLGNVFLWGRNYDRGIHYSYNYEPVKIYYSNGIKDIAITDAGVAVIENDGVLKFIR